MHSLNLGTRLFKAIGKLHLSRCYAAALVCDSRLICRRRLECYRNFRLSLLGRNSRMRVTDAWNVPGSVTDTLADKVSSVDDASRSNGNLLEVLVLRLNEDIRRLGRVYRSDVERLLQELKSEDVVQANQNTGILLLHCCGNLLPDEHPTFRVNLVHEVWKSLQGLGITFFVEHYNTLLSSYAENGYRIVPSEFLTKMHDANVKPNEMTYQLLLACVCEVGEVEQALDLVSRMKSEGFPVSEPVFKSLILGHARAGDLASAAAVLDTMRTAQVSPTVDTYTALMKGYVEAGDLDNVYRVHQEAEAMDMSVSEPHLMDMVKSAAKSGNQLLIPEILQLAPDGSLDLTPAVTNMAVHLIHLGCEKGAYFILRIMPMDFGLSATGDSSSFGSFVIQEMVKAGSPAQSIIEICDLLAADGRNGRALHKAAETALLMAHTELALIIFKALNERGAPLRPHYFWPIFLTLSKQKGEEGVLSVLDHMKDFGVNVNFETLLNYVLPYTSFGDPESLIRKLQTYGLKVSEVITPVVVILIKDGQIKTALNLCRRFQSPIDPDKLLRPLVQAYNSSGDVTSTVGLVQVMIASSAKEKSDWGGRFVIELLASSKDENEKIEAILKAYQRVGIPISSFAGETISNYFRNSSSESDVKNIEEDVDSLVHSRIDVSSSKLFNEHIPHPRDMSVEELRCHLVELKSKNLNTRGVLRRLLQLYVRQGSLEEAMVIKKELEDANCKVSAGMLSSIFELHVKLGRVDEAELALLELQKTAPTFYIDDFKIVNFATLLVENNKYEDAVCSLEKHAEQQRVRGGPNIVRNCWRLLHAVAKEGEPSKVKNMLDLLVQLQYCTISNIILGPLVRVHLIQGNLLGAVKEYKRCVSEYRKTPLQYELIRELLSIAHYSDSDTTRLLQEVIDVTRSVHGNNMNILLAIALAETGRRTELEKLVKNTGANFHQPVFNSSCRKLADDGNLSALENLAAVSDVIPGGRNLYTFMMRVYSQRGDCDGALALWTSLQERDIRPSQEFFNILVSLLRNNKREVSSGILTDMNRK